MNRLAIALVVSAAALAANAAHADSRVRIGVTIGSPVYHHPAPVMVAPPTVVYAAPPTVMYAPPPTVVVAAPRGYWKEVQVKTWVPERWVVRTNRWGRPERYFEPGYFAYHTDRVWVDGRSDHGRGYAYGYNAHPHGYSRDHRWSR